MKRIDKRGRKLRIFGERKYDNSPSEWIWFFHFLAYEEKQNVFEVFLNDFTPHQIRDDVQKRTLPQRMGYKNVPYMFKHFFPWTLEVPL